VGGGDSGDDEGGLKGALCRPFRALDFVGGDPGRCPGLVVGMRLWRDLSEAREAEVRFQFEDGEASARWHTRARKW
jgi:hypothetical protein